MKDIRIYIGHNVGTVPTHTQEDIARAIAACDIEGCTLIECRGLWHGVYEDTTCALFACVDDEWAEHFAKEIVPQLCVLLEQECIMVETRESACVFVTGNVR